MIIDSQVTEFIYISIIGFYSSGICSNTQKVNCANYSTGDIKVHRGDLKKKEVLANLKAKFLSSLRLHNTNKVDNEEFYE